MKKKLQPFLNGPTPASFSSFETKNTIFTTNQCEKLSCPSSIQCQDLNPRPLKHESSPIITRRGLPPELLNDQKNPAILPGRPEGRLSTTTSPDCKDCLDDEMDDDDAARPAPTSPASTVDVVAPPSYEESPPAVPDFFVSGEGLEKNCNQS